MSATDRASLIVDTNIQAYFRDVVTEAVSHQKLNASDETVYYLVNLLTTFTRSDQLYEQTPDGIMIRPLATMYADAVQAPSLEDRNQALKRLGDVALFIAGVFADSLNRKVVDVDYYIAMGGNAYGCLSDSVRGAFRWRGFSGVFSELADRFTDFVDVLDEVCEHAPMRSADDTVRLYELWQRTGSERVARRLQRLGVQPLAVIRH